MLLKVVGVRMELSSKQPVIILRGRESVSQNQHVAVVVGHAEAAAVGKALQGEIPPRPLTHDLLVTVLEEACGGVKSVEVHLLDSSTYAGIIRLNNGTEFDARASDAIAVAVRTDCTITMDKDTLDKVSVVPREVSQKGQEDTPQGSSPEAETSSRKDPISEDEIREFQKFISGADPEDFNRS